MSVDNNNDNTQTISNAP